MKRRSPIKVILVGLSIALLLMGSGCMSRRFSAEEALLYLEKKYDEDFIFEKFGNRQTLPFTKGPDQAYFHSVRYPSLSFAVEKESDIEPCFIDTYQISVVQLEGLPLIREAVHEVFPKAQVWWEAWLAAGTFEEQVPWKTNESVSAFLERASTAPFSAYIALDPIDLENKDALKENLVKACEEIGKRGLAGSSGGIFVYVKEEHNIENGRFSHDRNIYSIGWKKQPTGELTFSYSGFDDAGDLQ